MTRACSIPSLALPAFSPAASAPYLLFTSTIPHLSLSLPLGAAPLGVQLLAPSLVHGFSAITAAATSVSASFLNVQSWSALLEVGKTNKRTNKQKTLEKTGRYRKRSRLPACFTPVTLDLSCK